MCLLGDYSFFIITDTVKAKFKFVIKAQRYLMHIQINEGKHNNHTGYEQQLGPVLPYMSRNLKARHDTIAWFWRNAYLFCFVMCLLLICTRWMPLKWPTHIPVTTALANTGDTRVKYYGRWAVNNSLHCRNRHTYLTKIYVSVQKCI